jgi:Do/DeqQ family serine protease
MKNLSRYSLLKVTTIAALAVFAVGSCKNAGDATLTSAAGTETTAIQPTSQAPIVLADGIRASYADIVERVAPAVVNIEARKRAAANDGDEDNPIMNDPRFREMFPNVPRGNGGGQPQQPQLQRGIGSGVIVNSDGTILTNYHVVEGATEITIELTDKRTFKAKVIGTDEATDLAVLKVEATNLPFLNLGDSDKVRVGDVALAIGDPLGIGQTVTLGIISAKSRRTGIGTGSFEDFLQTDAPINRGNSGGALINVTGELIGINSQILSSGNSGGSIGIGFAIPSNMAKGVMEQLVKNGKVVRGQLGVNIQDVTSDIAASVGLNEARGAIVSNVVAGSAADKAGVKRGDVITQINGERVEDGNALRNRVAGTQPGTEVTLTVLRDGREQQIKAKLNELAPDQARNNQQTPQQEAAPENNAENSGKLGLSLEPLTPELGKRLQLEGTDKGMVVTEVDPNGAGADAGIRAQDVILEINRQPVGTFEEAQAALAKSGDKSILLLVGRRGQTVYLTVQPRK